MSIGRTVSDRLRLAVSVLEALLESSGCEVPIIGVEVRDFLSRHGADFLFERSLRDDRVWRSE